VGTLTFKKKPRSSIGQEIRPKNAFIAYRALLPSANSSADDLVGCDILQQIVMAVSHAFTKN
jgi:hypothetical protein